jgi:hypothetical protein
MVDVLLPRAPRPAPPAFTGDAAPLVGTYSGPARGRPMTVTITATGSGLAMAVNTGRANPLSWVEGWRFMAGGQLVIFERSGNSGPATVVRLDSGGGHYVLRRQ